MANDESHYGCSSCKSAATFEMESPWKQEEGVPLGCLNNYSAPGHVARIGGDEVAQRAIRDEDVESSRGHLPDDLEDESGLELCLGLSLGGSVCKAKSKNKLKEECGSDQGGNEKAKEEHSSRSPVSKDHEEPPRRVWEGGLSRTQAFWQELLVQLESLKEETVNPLDSDCVRERHAQSHSSSSIGGRISIHLEVGESWCSTKDPIGKDSKAAFAHQFWQTVQENASLVDKTDVKEEKPFLKDPLPVPEKANAASRLDRVGKGEGVMQLLDRLKAAEDGDPKSLVCSSGKKCSGPSFAVQAGGSASSIPASGNCTIESQHSAEGGLVPFPQSTSFGKGKVSSQVESYKAAAEQQQRPIQEAMEQKMKHRMQEARKKRKVFLEEQKLQKKVKKDDDCRVGSGLSAKQFYQSTRPVTPASGSKVSSTGPLLATSREVSTGTREVSTPPDSQDGESTNSGFHKTGSVIWQHVSSREGVGASARDKPSDNTDSSTEKIEGKQLREIRRALQRERDRAAMDKGKEPGKEKLTESRPGDSERRSPGDVAHLLTYKEEPAKLHPVGDLASHIPFGAISAPSDSRLDLKAVLVNSGWVHRVAEIHVTAERRGRNHILLKKLPDFNGFQRKGDFNKTQRRCELDDIQGRGDLSGIKSKGASSAISSANRETVDAFGQCAVRHAKLNEECSRMEYRDLEVPIATGGGKGVKSSENLAKRSVSPAKDVQKKCSGPLLPIALSASSGLVPGGALAQLQSGSSLLKSGPLQSRSDASESFWFPEGNVNSSSSFANLVATIDASPARSVLMASFSDGADQHSPGGVLPSFGQVEACDDASGVTNYRKGRNQKDGLCCTESVTNAPTWDEYEGKNFRGSRYQQGTTQAMSTAEGLVIHLGQEASSLRLGIAAGQVFGGSGSSPDLPWVTCTDAEQNGKSICGVLYRYKKGQVKIVCACHGCHMFPSEFVQHAGCVDLATPKRSILVGSFALGSQIACVQGLI